MKRVVITGAHGAGKSTLAKRLHQARSEVPRHGYDAIKLSTDWQIRPQDQIDADLRRVVSTSAWILVGGPSMLPVAVPHADLVIWLDPPLPVRAWRLLRRPILRLGESRPELPTGNRDTLGRQWRFAVRSLRRDRAFFNAVRLAVTDATCPVLHCSTAVDVESAVTLWGGTA